MLKLIFRDLFMYQKRNLIVLPGFALLNSFLIRQWDTYIPFAFILSFTLVSLFSLIMTAQTAFAYDEMSKFNKFLRAMPISPSTIVLSRYASCLISGILGAVVTLVLSLIINLIPAFRIESQVSFSPEAIALWIFAIGLTSAILIPILFKFGYMKSKYPLFLIFIVLGSSPPMIFSSTKINSNFMYKILSIPNTFIYIFVVLFTLLAFYCSTQLSIGIFKKKEI